MLIEAHEVFSDANRKSHMQPQRLSPNEERELLAIAALGRDLSDNDAEDE